MMKEQFNLETQHSFQQHIKVHINTELKQRKLNYIRFKMIINNP